MAIIKKIFATATGLTIIGILAYLSTIPGVHITVSGDISCAGTKQDPCISYFNITSANFTLKFYGYGKDKLVFSPDIQSYSLYKLTSTGKWTSTKFPINMTKGVTYQFKLVGYKNSPLDNVKWGVSAGDAYADPWWNSTYGYKYPIIENTTVVYATSVNDTNGVKGNIIWALTNNESYVYSTASGPTGIIAIANDTNEKFWENETNALTGFSSKSIWSSIGAIGVYHFGEGSGTTAIDSAGTYNGTITSATYTTTGRFGKAMNFLDGRYVNLTTSSISTCLNGNFTIEMWVYPNNTLQSVFFGEKGGTHSRIIGIGYPNPGNGFGTLDENTAVIQSQGVITGITGAWQHVVWTYNDTNDTSNLYVNGTLVSSVEYTISATSAQIFINAGPGGSGYNGTIDEVRIYNRILGGPEILHNYQNSINQMTRLGASQAGDAPTFSADATNTTITGLLANFTVNVTDDKTLDSNAAYIFSTNNTGAWKNSSAAAFAGSGLTLTAWNVTALNSTNNTFVQWKFFANDTDNQWSVSSTYSLTTYTPSTIITILENGTDANYTYEFNEPINITVKNRCTSLTINASPSYGFGGNISSGVLASKIFNAFASIYNFTDGTIQKNVSSAGNVSIWTHRNYTNANATFFVNGTASTNATDVTLDILNDTIIDLKLAGNLWANGSLIQDKILNGSKILNYTFISAGTKTFTVEVTRNISFISSTIDIIASPTVSNNTGLQLNYVRNGSTHNYASQVEAWLKYNQTQDYTNGINSYPSGTVDFNLTVPTSALNQNLIWHGSYWISGKASYTGYIRQDIFNYTSGAWQETEYGPYTSSQCVLVETTWNLSSDYTQNNVVMLRENAGTSSIDVPGSTSCYGYTFTSRSIVYIDTWFKINSVPTNLNIKVGGYSFYNSSGSASTSTATVGNFTSFNRSVSACSAGFNNVCNLTFTITSNSGGRLNVSNIRLIGNVNPVRLNITTIENLKKTSSNVNIAVNTTINAAYFGSGINVTHVDWFYYGAISYGIYATNSTTTLTNWVKIFYTNMSIVKPYNWTESLMFYPASNSSKNVTPFGQTSSIPIFNITGTAYEKNMSVGIRLDQTLSSCLNFSYSNTSTGARTKVNTSLSSATQFSTIYGNLNNTGNFGIWLFLDLWNCSSSTRFFVPNFTIKSCCIGCMSCF